MLFGRDDGAYLWKLPRRGGAVEVQVIRELRGPTGLDLHRDGRVCVADPRLRKVVELLPDGDGGGYVVAPRELLDVQAVDCVYGDDGAIHALVRGEPSRVVVWSADRTRFTMRDAGGAGLGAWQLDLRGPDNYFVTPAEGGGVAHHASTRVRLDLATARLMVNNEPLGPALTDTRIPTRPTRFHVALREDGYALVLPAFAYNQMTDLGSYRIQAVRLRDGDLQEFARWGQEVGFSAAMGVRPGGPTTNPWTGVTESVRGSSASVPKAPARLAGGMRESTAPKGCSVTPGPAQSAPAQELAAFALIAVTLRRVRRRSGPRARRRRLARDAV